MIRTQALATADISAWRTVAEGDVGSLTGRMGPKTGPTSDRLEPLVVFDQGIAKNVLEREQFEVTLLGE